MSDQTARAGPETLVASLFRHESGRLVAAMTRLFGPHNLELADGIHLMWPPGVSRQSSPSTMASIKLAGDLPVAGNLQQLHGFPTPGRALRV